MLDTLKTFARPVGIALSVAALAFIGWEIAHSEPSAWALFATPAGWIRLASLAAVYALALYLVFAAWLVLVRDGGQKLVLTDGLNAYGLFQIYKYLPTNVVHYASRYVVLRKHGIGHAVIIWSTGAELALISLAAVALGIGGGGREVLAALWPESVPSFPLVVVAAGAAVAAFAAILLLWRRDFAARLWLAAQQRYLQLGYAFLLHCAFFGVTGLMLHLLIGWNTDGPVPPLSVAIAANAVAWVIGTLTPGAPGGIGVREFVLMLMLKPYGLDAAAIAVVSQLRLISVMGDVLFYTLACAAERVLRRRQAA